MKIFNLKVLSLLLGIMFSITACETIEVRDELENSFDPNNIELQVVQATDGGNKLSIQMNTEGVAGYWDYILDKKYSDRVEVVWPYTGTVTFTYHVTTPYLEADGVSYISKTVSVDIKQLDEKLPDAYYNLVGADLGGKEWVFDGTPVDGGLWWFMSDPANNPWGVWWNAAGECCPPVDAAGKMKFDVNGGQNYTYWGDASDASTQVTGSTYAFNSDYTKITISGAANILGSMDGGGNAGTFDIVELTADKMVLYVPDAAWATGWTWVFKPL